MRGRGPRGFAAGPGPWVGAVLALCALLALGATLYLRGDHPRQGNPAATASAAAATQVVAYVDNQTCLGCHAEQARAWSNSHHAHAMDLATPAFVRGAFDGREFLHQGVRSRFFRRGERFYVHTDGADGKLADFEIQYTFGVEPLQQYLIAMPGGRLQALQIAWNDQKKEWFQLRPEERTPPGDVLHWTGRYQTANTLCIVCHTTAYEKRYDPVNDRFASSWKEANVSCQACHGPGQQHVQWAQASAADQARWTSAGPKGLTVDSHSAQPHATQDLCAPCHSRRSELTAQGVPGQPLLDHFLPSVLRTGLYHADGQQLEEVYVDGSFRQSKMFQKGVGCTNCHNPHSGTLKLPGNAVCLQCHASARNPAFPGAAGNYDTPGHHFHSPGSAGAQCVNCHMPSKRYMGVQARPDHSLRVPRPDLSVKLGVPNACTNCHARQSAAWAAAAVTQWYGPQRRQETHFGEALTAYRSGAPQGAEALVAQVADANVQPIVRATALDALRGNATTGLPVRIAALSDPAAEVRAAAADSLEGLEPTRRMEVLAPRLTDPVRAVRMAAARSLSTIPRQQLEPTLWAAFDAAVADYVAAQSLSLDMPGARLNLAVLYENLGQGAQAEQQYLAALVIDPDFSPARLNLARIYGAQGRLQEAQRLLQTGLQRVPGIGEMHNALGLLRAQSGDLPGAIAALQKAATLLPTQARIQYNLGLAYQQVGQARRAEQALLAAAQRAGGDPDIAYALAAFYLHANRIPQAQRWTATLQAAFPDDERLPALQQALRNSPAP